MQRGLSSIVILVGILIISGIAIGAYYLNSLRTINPNPSKVGTLESPSPNNETSDWKNYETGQNLDGITINYPKGWSVNYRKRYNLSEDYTANHRIEFDFAPSSWNSPEAVNWMGWGILSFDVYDPQKSSADFINKNYPSHKDNFQVKEVAMIGGKSTFLEEGKEDFYWDPREIILGSKYSYEKLIGSQDGYFSEDGKENFVTILKREIYPQIKID